MLLPPDGLIIRAICDNILTSKSKIGDPKSKMRTAERNVAEALVERIVIGEGELHIVFS